MNLKWIQLFESTKERTQKALKLHIKVESVDSLRSNSKSLRKDGTKVIYAVYSYSAGPFTEDCNDNGPMWFLQIIDFCLLN